MKQVKKEQARDFAVTILTSGCHFEGKMFCRGSTRVGGHVKGEIISEGLLILEEESVVDADIECEEIVLQGKVNGTLKAKKRVEMSKTCVFVGDLNSPSLVVEEGAQFSGRSVMGPEGYSGGDSRKIASGTSEPKVTELSSSNKEVKSKSPNVAAEA